MIPNEIYYYSLHFAGHSAALSSERWLFSQEALQEYVLICCQTPTGGMGDRPGKSKDFYHTCYGLSGLSLAQNFNGCDGDKRRLVVGPPQNDLVRLRCQTRTQ